MSLLPRFLIEFSLKTRRRISRRIELRRIIEIDACDEERNFEGWDYIRLDCEWIYIYIFKMLVVLFFIESLLHLYNLEKIVLNRIIGRISRSGIILLNVILSCNLRNEMIYYYFLKVSLTTRYLHLQNEIIGFW